MFTFTVRLVGIWSIFPQLEEDVWEAIQQAQDMKLYMDGEFVLLEITRASDSFYNAFWDTKEELETVEIEIKRA